MGSPYLFFTNVTLLLLMSVIFTILTNGEGFYIQSARSNRESPFNETTISSFLGDNGRYVKSRLGGPGLSSKLHRPEYFIQRHRKKGIETQFQCGTAPLSGIERRGRIVGGNAVSTPIPWQVSLQSKDEQGNWRHICGAALISQYHVLTASHCIGLESHTKYRVVLGKLKINEVGDHEQMFYIRDADITTHRQFGFDTEFGNDIAILKIEDRQGRGAIFNDYVQPICIPPNEGWEYKMISQKTKCLVSGWGSTKEPFYDDFSNSLQVASVPIHTQEMCKNLYNEAADNWTGNWLKRSSREKRVLANIGSNPYGGSDRYMDGMLCAGPLSGKYVDSSRGDSGGPLACKMNGQYFLVGLTSWGDHFSIPSVYTRVSHYLPWLNTEKILLGPAF